MMKIKFEGNSFKIFGDGGLLVKGTIIEPNIPPIETATPLFFGIQIEGDLCSLDQVGENFYNKLNETIGVASKYSIPSIPFIVAYKKEDIIKALHVLIEGEEDLFE